MPLRGVKKEWSTRKIISERIHILGDNKVVHYFEIWDALSMSDGPGLLPREKKYCLSVRPDIRGYPDR